MAKVRFSHLDDFVLKDDGKVGIGTSLPSTKVEVIGTVKAANIKVNSGITTIASIDGYMNQDMEYSDNVSINIGDSGTLSGEIVVGSGLTMSIGTGATTGQGSIESLKVSNTFTPPIGFTTDRPTAPKAGSLFYNKDFKTIEYWDGNFWRQVDNTTRRGRGLYMGGNPGSSPYSVSDIDYVEIATLGNSINFGDLVVARDGPAMGQVSSSVRGIAYAGHNNPAGGEDEIDYVTIASAGKATDFGNAQQATGWGAGCSSSTRGFKFGGYVSGAQANIEYVEIATVGTSYDWGADIILARESCTGFSSPTRGFMAAGMNGGTVTGTIEVLTMASKGTATVEFGEMTGKRRGVGTVSNSVRGVIAGGRYSSPQEETHVSTIDVVTMSSDGNAQYFGELTQARRKPAGASNQIRGVFASGYLAPAQVTTIDYITIDTAGNAVSFGDLMEARNGCACASDSHGGLGGF